MSPTLGRLTALISLALMLNHSSVKSVTLYSVAEPLASETVSGAGSVSVSVGGTNSDGGTTYVEVVAETSLVIIIPSNTITLISVPSTVTATFVEDASGVRGSVEMGYGTTQTGEQTCGFGSDGRGTCVDTFTGPSRTDVLTVSGSVVPWYTVPATQPSAQESGALRSAVQPLIIAAAVVVALFYA